MSLSKLPLAAMSLAVVIVAGTGCSVAPLTAPKDLPPALQAPADQVVFLEARATGVQIYECAAKADSPSAFEWAFRAPEASLVDRKGLAIGKHYAGPTWESVDGSSVVGALKARDSGPDRDAIPWLLLTAKSTSGAGTFAPTKSVQRVQTVGGSAPSDACGANNLGQVSRVPYTATYYFYRSAN